VVDFGATLASRGLPALPKSGAVLVSAARGRIAGAAMLARIAPDAMTSA
jgi:hypothetical protein